jgi:hypothetical protein
MSDLMRPHYLGTIEFGTARCNFHVKRVQLDLSSREKINKHLEQIYFLCVAWPSIYCP